MSDRVEFAELVESLISQVVSDLDDPEWVKKRSIKKMRDTDGTLYRDPFPTHQKRPIRFSLDPNAYDIPGDEAAVDL